MSQIPGVQDAFNVDASISTTPEGFLTGVEPAARVTSTTSNTIEAPAPSVKTFTQEEVQAELAKARQQEKDKLYSRIDSLSQRLSEFENERKTAVSAEEQARKAAEEEARRQAESEMSARELLEQRDREWQARFEAERQEREKAFALLEQEKAYQALVQYRQERLAQEQDNIIPELLDMVYGDTPEEIDSSLNSLKERSARILEAAQLAAQNARREMPGARVTAPGVGPMDINTDQNQFTPEAIRGMPMSEYAKNRARLIGNSPTSRGLFG